MTLKYVILDSHSTLDTFTIAADIVSVTVLIILAALVAKTVRAFKQSKQALRESASIISVIVDALTSRIEQSESAVNQTRTDVDGLKTRMGSMEWEQNEARSSSLRALKRLEEALSNDKHFSTEIQSLKAEVASLQRRRTIHEPIEKRANLGGVVSKENVLSTLTPTERATLQILNAEGSKAAPELGQRLGKSREHTSRLMKKLYLEGYVDRESNRAPFRYRLSETARSALESQRAEVTEKEPERV
jgi:DNA-binding MarR family transcriptional regulator